MAKHDGGSNEIQNAIVLLERKIFVKYELYKNFSFESYIYLMHKSSLIIGNSSSGVREGHL